MRYFLGNFIHRDDILPFDRRACRANVRTTRVFFARSNSLDSSFATAATAAAAAVAAG